MTWAQTRNGTPVDLLSDEPIVVDIEECFAQLHRLQRFSGATTQPWSVLDHSLLVVGLVYSWGAPLEVQLEALLHDASEYVTGDITRPMQDAVRFEYEHLVRQMVRGDENISRWIGYGDPLQRIRERVDVRVRAGLGLNAQEHPLVKRADQVAVAIERRDLMATCDREWTLSEYAPLTPKLDRVEKTIEKSVELYRLLKGES